MLGQNYTVQETRPLDRRHYLVTKTEPGQPEDIRYEVTQNKDGSGTCTCLGFHYRGKCKHVAVILGVKGGVA